MAKRRRKPDPALIRAGELAREMVTLNIQMSAGSKEADKQLEERINELLLAEDDQDLYFAIVMLVNYVRGSIEAMLVERSHQMPSPRRVGHAWHQIAEQLAAHEQQLAE
jgi:chemotaxis regulatin CheY-phosphate phosphatase CheZ